MTVNVGGDIGRRLIELADKSVGAINICSLAVVTRVDLDKMKVDVKLKNKKGENVVDLFACPVVSQSYAGGGMMNFPRVGDLVVAVFCKYNVERHLKSASLQIDDTDERGIHDQNFAFIIGTVFPAPESTANIPEGEDSGVGTSPESVVPANPPFNRDPIHHAEKVNRVSKFMNERINPAQDHYVWYHPYDHEIRMTRQEVFIKHKTGTQIIMREVGDLEIYVKRKILCHACDDITINSERNARMNSGVAHKEPPFRV